jgi:DNA-binding MarR family transcriptional regulator
MSRASPTPGAKSYMGRTVLDTDRHVPYFFTFISNKLSNSASALYRKQFRIGITEWRVMSVLASKPNINGNQVASYLGTDKAAISRSLRRLEKLRWVSLSQDKNDSRSRTIQLSSAGLTAHDEIIKVALDREKRLLSTLSAEEREIFIRCLQKLRGAVGKEV